MLTVGIAALWRVDSKIIELRLALWRVDSKIIELRLALLTTYSEMDFLWRMGQQYAPADFLLHQHRSGLFHRK